MSKVTKAVEVLGAILGVSAVILVSFGLANRVHGQQFAGVMCVVGWAFIWLFYFILHPMVVALEDKFVEPARETARKNKALRGSRLPSRRRRSQLPAAQFKITFARWGVDNRWLDVTDRLNRMIEAGRLTTQATNEAMGDDPAPGVSKSLEVMWDLEGRGFQDHFNESAAVVLPRR
jgi:hypothetical protein